MKILQAALQMKETLTQAGIQFRQYERAHKAKNTEEGFIKARTNAVWPINVKELSEILRRLLSHEYLLG